MVIEDYSPFLISVIYLQDLGLLSYSRHRPLVNWASPFWAGTRGQAALLGLPLFWGPVDGRLFSNPINIITSIVIIPMLSRFNFTDIIFDYSYLFFP